MIEGVRNWNFCDLRAENTEFRGRLYWLWPY